MKVRLSRGYNGNQPCCCATREIIKRYDWRPCETLAEVKKTSWGPAWLAEGSNHREENGRVVKEKMAPVWTLDLDTKEDYDRFFQEHPFPMKIEDDTEEYPEVPRLIKLED